MPKRLLVPKLVSKTTDQIVTVSDHARRPRGALRVRRNGPETVQDSLTVGALVALATLSESPHARSDSISEQRRVLREAKQRGVTALARSMARKRKMSVIATTDDENDPCARPDFMAAAALPPVTASGHKMGGDENDTVSPYGRRHATTFIVAKSTGGTDDPIVVVDDDDSDGDGATKEKTGNGPRSTRPPITPAPIASVPTPVAGALFFPSFPSLLLLLLL